MILEGSLTDEETNACLDGQLPFFEALDAPLVPTFVGASKSAIGSAIAFSRHMPMRPALMLSTRIRLIDFSLGAIQRFAGNFTTAWAPVALTHVRADVTTSGRGALAGYAYNEDLAYRLMHALSAAFDHVGGPGCGRLAECAKHLQKQGTSYEADATDTLSLWSYNCASVEHLQERSDATLAAYAADLRNTYRATGRAKDRRDFHNMITAKCREELARYGRQIELWQHLQDVNVSAEFRERVPG